eukprot:TRINITY_DN6514_c0_g1_i4.p1 TRINITY_DN6514_c0_g1~~TRINITY_DN6514_c0_g1_i4.p1  ORF type:complete len:220 (-),score=32.47 TRINITY_DN6514_c0_g1_i4:40-699(-)
MFPSPFTTQNTAFSAYQQQQVQQSSLAQEGPTQSFSFDTPELTPLRTTNEVDMVGMTPRSVATPRSITELAGQNNNCNMPLFAPELSPRSPISGMLTNFTSIASSNPGINLEDLDLVNSVNEEDLELLIALLSQVPVQQNNNAYNMASSQMGGVGGSGMANMNAGMGMGMDMGGQAAYIQPQAILGVNDKFKVSWSFYLVWKCVFRLQQFLCYQGTYCN